MPCKSQESRGVYQDSQPCSCHSAGPAPGAQGSHWTHSRLNGNVIIDVCLHALVWNPTIKRIQGHSNFLVNQTCGPARARSYSLHCWVQGWQHTPLCSAIWEIAALGRMTKKIWTVRSKEEANIAQRNEELPLQSHCWNICNPCMGQPLSVTALLGWGKEWKFHLVQFHSSINYVLLWKRNVKISIFPPQFPSGLTGIHWKCLTHN